MVITEEHAQTISKNNGKNNKTKNRSGTSLYDAKKAQSISLHLIKIRSGTTLCDAIKAQTINPRSIPV